MSKDLTINCLDGIQLAGTLFETEKLKGAVMIGPATGIRPYGSMHSNGLIPIKAKSQSLIII